MARGPARASDPNIRALSQPLLDATPRQLVRVVGLVDALGQRGAMDELIAMVRPRLGRLRPARPLRFARLLFTPLDPVIVPPQRWRTEDATVPTIAIPPIAETLRAAEPALVTEVEAMISDRTMRDSEVVMAAGTRLWPEAARSLIETPAPVGWEDCGLNLAVYPTLVRRVGAILLSAATIHTMAAEQESGAPGPTEEDLGTMMRRTAEVDPDALRALLIILLNRLPDQAGAIITIATRAGAADGISKRALDEAADTIMRDIERSDVVETRVEQAALSDAAANAGRMARVLQALDQERAPPARREMLRAARAKLEQSCRGRFSDGLMHEFLTPLGEMMTAGAGANPAAEVMTLEDVARDLRALEANARALGGGGVYDKLLERAAEALRAGNSDGPLGPLERARLTEIIAGPDAALALLEGTTGKIISELPTESTDH